MYKLKDGTTVNDPQWIMPDEWINDRVREQICERYPKDEQDKLNRLANAKSLGIVISDNDYNAFIAYNAYAEECRSWGREQKAIYAERRLKVIEEVNE